MIPLFAVVLEIAGRSLGAILILFLLAKLIGPRQIAQLTFYDYVVGISIGSIAAAIAIDVDLSFWLGSLAMLLFALVSIAMSLAGSKSIRARRFLSGVPVILVYRGHIVESALKKRKYDVNELLGACRTAGYFDLADLDYVIMEINGTLSFLPKSEKAPLTPADMNLSPPFNALSANVVMDGCIMEQHLAAIGRDRDWLDRRLAAENISDVHDVLLACADEKGGFHVWQKGIPGEHDDFFE